jgi:hypothetical protein
MQFSKVAIALRGGPAARRRSRQEGEVFRVGVNGEAIVEHRLPQGRSNGLEGARTRLNPD